MNNDLQIKPHELPAILVVEDDEGLRHLIQNRLERNNFKVTEATTGKNAVTRALEDPNLLMLLDFKLTDMTGGEVIDELKTKGYLVPFVIMTGNGDEKIAVEMMKLGARDYLVKDKGFLDVLPQVMDQVIGQLMTEKKLAEMEKKLH
ncbi:MAG: response regulator, partial [Acidobacteria bacterium]|nr:response regulator [Acidobacteriota bacterium]